MIKNSLATKIALATFGVAFVAIITLSLFAYDSTKNIVKENMLENIHRNIDSEAMVLEFRTKDVKNDILRIATSTEMRGLMRSWFGSGYDEQENISLVTWKKRTKRLFRTMMQEKDHYVQMRIIMANSDGREYIRLDRKDGLILSVKQKRLQEKGHRDYVRRGFETKDGDVYISKTELNREYGDITVPYLPVIRAITPLINEKGRQFAILVINVDVNSLNKSIILQQKKENNFFIANFDGSYLINYDNTKLFGVDLGHAKRVQNDFEIGDFLSSSEKIVFEHSYDNLAVAMKKVFYNQNNKQYFWVLGMQSSSLNIDKKVEKLRIQWTIIIFTISFFIALLSALVVSRMTKHLRALTHSAKLIGRGEKVDLNIDSDDEVGVLSHTLHTTLTNLEESKSKLLEFADSLEDEVVKKTKELQDVNDSLEERVLEQLGEVRKKDQMLIQQSRLASMGEMIGNIAHQWRQPLNALSINIQNTQMMYESGELNDEYVEKNTEKALFFINKMSATIDDFRNFFKQDKEKEPFVVAQMVKQSQMVVEEALNHNGVDFYIKGELDAKAYGFKSEFSQVLLNIINNSKDAHRDNSTNEPYIRVTIKVDKENIVVDIEDNAGGIPEEILEKVFDPYFTTKDDDGGTGIGLYMSKVIMEKMDGTIFVENIKDGAKFIITIPLYKDLS